MMLLGTMKSNGGYKLKDLIFESKKFFRKYLMKISITSIILGLILFILSMVLNRGNITEELERTEDSIYDVGDVVISIYVEEQDGSKFENTAIIEQYLRTDASLSLISEATGTNIDELVDEERELTNNTGEDNDRVLTTNKNQYSSLMEIIISTDDSEKNIDIGEYISDNLIELLPFLENKSVYNVGNNPKVIESVNSVVDTTESNDSLLSLSIRLVSAIILIAIALTIGFFIKEYFTRFITFKHTVFRNPNDIYLITSNNGYNRHLIKPFVKSSIKTQQYLLRDPEVLNYSIPELDNLEVISSLDAINYESSPLEVIIIINAGHTRRDWYKKVKESLSYKPEVSIKIIQID